MYGGLYINVKLQRLIKVIVTAYEHSTNRPIGNSRKLVLLRGLMVDCDQRTSTVLKNNYYFLIHWYKGETLIIGMFHCIFM